MTPRENCYILGYEGPIKISQVVPDKEQNLIYFVKVSDSDDETVTHGSPHKLANMNSLEISHLWKTLISPNW